MAEVTSKPTTGMQSGSQASPARAPGLQTAAPSTHRPRPVIHAVLFVLGFSAIFVSVGAVVSGIGQIVFDLRQPLARIGGVVVILFGLATMGLFNAASRELERLAQGAGTGKTPWWLLPMLGLKAVLDGFLRYFYADTRADWGRRGGNGYLASFLMGTFFAAGWTPCIGPTLGAILMLGYNAATVNQGVLLLSAYSLGLGIPFLLFALALDRTTGLLRSLRRHMRAVQVMNGALLLLIGFALLTNQLALIAQWAQERNLYLDVGLSGGVTPTFFIAIVAGLLSFLSPCVLPLVPAYVFYLSGRTLSQTTAG